MTPEEAAQRFQEGFSQLPSAQDIVDALNDWSNTYRTQVLQVTLNDGTPSTHLIIERHDGAEITATWSEIQAIKDEMIGEDVYMVEVYPESNHVVNEVNRRHLWSVPREKLGLKW